MKQITIDGRIGKDGAKSLESKGGKKYLRFSLANDSFVNGANKTEWFDVTCFDPFVVENRANFLTKGRYVIVSGTLNSEVSAKDGKIYLNQYVRATDIDFPSLGGKKEETNEAHVSTYTGGTKSESAVHEAPTPQPVAAPAGWIASQAPEARATDDDDLPF